MPSPRTHVLLAAADSDARQHLTQALQHRGLHVETVGSLGGWPAAGQSRLPDVLVLDLDLQGLPRRPLTDGLALLRGLRLHCSLPLVVLSHSADAADRVLALDSGADELMTKPVACAELVARIQALVRRAQAGAGGVAGAVQWRSGAWVLDGLGRTLARDAIRDGSPPLCVRLTEAEFRLMRAFFERPRRVLTRGDLLALGEADSPVGAGRGPDLLVSRLRGKLGDDARAPRWLHTVRGSGYRFDLGGTPTSAVSPAPTTQHQSTLF